MYTFWKSTAPARNRIQSAYNRSASVLSFNHDGLEIARVRSERRWLPFWHIAVFLYLALLIRLIAMADLGPAAYAHRMTELESGSWIERATARVMWMDPMSRQIAYRVRTGIKKVEALQ